MERNEEGQSSEPQSSAPAVTLPPALEEAIASWENSTRQTLGPQLETAAFNALSGCLASIRGVIAGAI